MERPELDFGRIKDMRLSEILEIALYDLQQAVDDQLIIDMGVYYEHGETNDGSNKICAVCLAGAVMRGAVGDEFLMGSSAYEYRTKVGTDFPQITRFLNEYRSLWIDKASLVLCRISPHLYDSWIALVANQPERSAYHGVLYGEWLEKLISQLNKDINWLKQKEL